MLDYVILRAQEEWILSQNEMLNNVRNSIDPANPISITHAVYCKQYLTYQKVPFSKRQNPSINKHLPKVL